MTEQEIMLCKKIMLTGLRQTSKPLEASDRGRLVNHCVG